MDDESNVALRLGSPGRSLPWPLGVPSRRTASERIAKLFNRFYKGAGSGMGLDLTIARSLVEAHGGTTRAESQAAEQPW